MNNSCHALYSSRLNDDKSSLGFSVASNLGTEGVATGDADVAVGAAVADGTFSMKSWNSSVDFLTSFSIFTNLS